MSDPWDSQPINWLTPPQFESPFPFHFNLAWLITP